MNILFVARFPFSNNGGVGRVTNTLAEEMTRRGHSSAFLAAGPRRDVEDRGTPQFYLPSSRIAAKANHQFLNDLLGRLNIEIIVNQSASEAGLVDLINNVKRNIAVISVHHGCVERLHEVHSRFVDQFFDSYHIPSFLRFRLFYFLLRERSRRKVKIGFCRAIAKSDKLVFLSKQLVSELPKYVSHPNMRKVAVIPNPAPFLPCTSALFEKENILLYVGKISVIGKRVDRLLKIWSLIEKANPDWRLEIVGEGPDEELLQNWARENSLTRVTFRGQCDPVPFYRRSKMLVMTSDFESFGMVLLEAQAFGCVPIASKSLSSVEEIIQNNTTGVVVRKETTTEFASLLQQLMGNSERLGRMARASVKGTERFSRERIAEEWLDLFRVLHAK